jgi:hypothetical protein
VIAALFIERDGVYWDLPGVDPVCLYGLGAGEKSA